MKRQRMSEINAIGLQLEQLESLRKTAENISKGVRQQLISGLNPFIRDIYIMHLAANYLPRGSERSRPFLLLAADDYKAAVWKRELERLLPGQAEDPEKAENPPAIYYYPAREIMGFETYARSNELTGQCLRAEAALLSGEPAIIVSSFAALSRKLFSPQCFDDHSMLIDTDSIIDTKTLAGRLADCGYERMDLVENAGQFSIRGGIVDIFPFDLDKPVRIELYGDEVDSIRSFDVDSQRSLSEITEIVIRPASELLLNAEKLKDAGERVLADHDHQIRTLQKKGRAEAAEKCRRRREYMAELFSAGVTDQNFEDYTFYFLDKDDLCLLDYLPPQAVIILDEPLRLQESAEDCVRERNEILGQMIEQGNVLPAQAANYLDWNALLKKILTRQMISFSLLMRQPSFVKPSEIATVQCARMNDYRGSWQVFSAEIDQMHERKEKIMLVMSNDDAARNLQHLLREDGREVSLISGLDRPLLPGETVIINGLISEGFELPQAKLAVITERNIFGTRHARDERKTKKEQSSVQSRGRSGKKKRAARGQEQTAVSGLDMFADLQAGDYVVHNVHGIGRFQGVKTMEVQGQRKDYLSIQYAGTDHLYLPVEQMDLIQKYIGSEEGNPRLSKFGGKEWSRVKQRVKESLLKMVGELVKLYAERSQVQGVSFHDSPEWEAEFAAAFPFEETDDQLQAIDEIFEDMKSPRPMDRLLCGDVGYGKTEVAMRAAFRAVMNGKQVAVLVPTTILAQQHFNNFSERFAPFGVNVGLLSRFRSPAEQKQIREQLSAGEMDVVIGTHGLLSDKVKFKELGLLIVDEEQKFGVSHKEKIKQMRVNVDVLTLTATPIPRTLNMALTGIRAMSTLQMPPENRLPVRTFVTEEDPALIREAITRELSRGGQVYYVSNRVQGIESKAEWLRQLVPEAGFVVAHAQMDNKMLENIMLSFMQGEYDVLVCTTIVENGLDIPNVNTLIVSDSQQLGLAQLYQLRGRVGRSSSQAYAYFTFDRDKVLNENAEKRLEAIREFTEFGSGFKIAMRDLQIRGSGNVLGAEQHGQVADVGYHMYVKLLEEAVQEAKEAKQAETEEQPQSDERNTEQTGRKGDNSKQNDDREHQDTLQIPQTTIDLNIDAFIDADYISDSMQKIIMYKKIAQVTSKEDIEEIADELIDRYGDPPPSVSNLLRIAGLKLTAAGYNIRSIVYKGNELIIGFDAADLPSGKALALLSRSFPRSRFVSPDNSGRTETDVLQFRFQTNRSDSKTILKEISRLFRCLDSEQQND